jgi:NAD dependent epimerase/dehydratase family enzyme
MDSKPLSVLVTGSSGFIGSHVVRQLHAAGHRVTTLDILKPKFPLPDGVEFRQCDIRQDYFPNRVFDAVVHLAALAGVRPSMTHSPGYSQTNVKGTLRLLKYCRSMGVPHFVFASSSSVCGPVSPLPFTEDGPTAPQKLSLPHRFSLAWEVETVFSRLRIHAMPPISAPMNPKNAPPTCRSGAREAFPPLLSPQPHFSPSPNRSLAPHAHQP